MRDAGSRLSLWIFATVLVVGTAVGAKFAGTHGAAFALCATLTVGSAILCLIERSMLRSAFALLATLLGTAGLFLLLESDFLAMTQVLVCVGGVLAMVLLGAMSETVKLEQRSLARICAALLVIVPLCAWFAWSSEFADAMTATDVRSDDRSAWILFGNAPADTNAASDAGRLGVALIDPKRYAVAFEVAAALIVVALIAAVGLARRGEEDER